MADLRMLWHGARVIGAANALRAVRNAWQRARLDARHAPPAQDPAPRPAGRLLSAQPAPCGAEFRFESARLRVRLLALNLAFLGWDGAEMEPSYAVAPTDRPPVETTLDRDGEAWRLRSGGLEIRIGRSGALEIVDAEGRLVRRDEPPVRAGGGWSQAAALPAEACVYGLGERAGRLNLRPGTYRFWNRDAGGCYGPGADPLYICMPLYLCMHQTGCHLVFYDNTFDGQIALGERAEIRFEGGPARWYVAVGSPAEVLEHLAALTGRPPLPPRWALGFFQSRWGYGSEAELRRVAAGFRRHDLPLSALVMDADHMRGYRTLTTDEERYPALAEFAEELRGSGVHLVASVNPAVKREPGLDLYDAGVAHDAFCRTPDGRQSAGVVWPGWAAFPDFTAPRVRAWWGAGYARHLRDGVDGFWHDMNEPSSFVAWGDGTLPLCTRHEMEGRGGDHREAHNVYGLLMNQAAWEGLRELRPGQRPWILSRSGWVGMQRHAWTWTGDVETTWAALRQTVACVLGLGLSGVPYAGPDIGGFAGAPGPELFVRWFQLASFLPFFRTHCAFYLPRREPWEWADEVLSILRDQLRLRTCLLPYWYTLAWQASQTGRPPVRPLFWAEPAEQALWEVDDAFLAGDALLVAPILAEGARQREVRLPAGRWFALDGSRAYDGGTQVALQAGLDCLPVLVRAGTVLPLAEGEGLALHVYRPADGEAGAGLLYGDAGDGSGPWRLDRWAVEPAGDGFDLAWSTEGEYEWPYAGVEGGPPGSVAVCLHGFGPGAVPIGGRPAELRAGRYLVRPGERLWIPA